MNFHPKALERGWRNHDTAWLAEDVFKEIRAIKLAHNAGTYKGNAQAALEAIIKAAHAAGKAGHGSAAAGYPAGQGAAWWAFYILTVCRVMEWYDPATLSPEELEQRRKIGGNLPQIS